MSKPDTEATPTAAPDGEGAPEAAAPETEATPSIADRVIETRGHYQTTTRRLFVAVFALTALCLLMAVIIAGLAMRTPTTQDFAVTKDLRVIKLTPLNQPLVSDEAVRNWSANALRTIYSFNFAHWRHQLNGTRHLFASDQAFSNFVKAMHQSGLVQTVRAKRLVVSSILRKPPTIVRKGVHNGHMTWKLEVPMTVRYQSSSSSTSQHVQVTMLVRRVKQTQDKNGIGISQIVAPKQ